MSELLLAGQTNDEILNSLSYKLAPTSEYIQQRRMSRFYPSGASSYSSNTTQIARIELKVLLEEILARNIKIEVDGDPEYVNTNFVNGIEVLNVKMSQGTGA